MLNLGFSNIASVSFGSNPIQKINYGTNLVWGKAGETDENLLPGFSYMTLPSIYYDEVDDNIWNQKIGSSGPIYMDYVIDSDTSVFFKFINDGFQYLPEFDLRTSETGGNELYFYIDNGIIKSESNTGEYYGEAVADGTFYGLVREAGNIKSVKTTNGTIFTTMYDFGDKSNYKYLGSWRYSSQSNKVYYPQMIAGELTGYTFSNVITWGDEFNYTGSPDSSKWWLEEGNGYGGYGNAEQQYYATENSVVSNNTLKITAKNESLSGYTYTSGRLNTLNKRMFQYGRFDIRAKLPTGGGMWPTVFMFGENHRWYDYSHWPECGEIDIVEGNQSNNSNKILSSVHTGYYNFGNGTSQSTSTDIATPNEFHNYRIDWTPDYIRWFLDDVQIKEFVNDGGDHSHWPFDDYFNLIIYLAVGGNFPGAIDSGALPQKFEIDYIRYYGLEGGYNTAPPSTVRPDAPVLDKSTGTKLISNSFPVSVISKPTGAVIRWYVGGFGYEGDTFVLPPGVLPVGVYDVVAIAVVDGVESLPAICKVAVVANP